MKKREMLDRPARWTLLSAALLVAASLNGQVSAQSLPEPEIGTLSRAAIEAQIEKEKQAPPLEADFEANEVAAKVEKEHAERNALRRGGAVADDDSAHYGRGSTAIVHVFINHAGGVWDDTERQAAAAKAHLAKQWYLDNAPPQANLGFDFEDGTGYYFFNALILDVLWETDIDVIEAAIAEIGFADGDGDGTAMDDMTLHLQTTGGGWDNVIAVFQIADRTGRAFAFYSWGVTVQYVDDTSAVWRHEWGHSFGACDEYVEDGQCNNGINCGPCQSQYLDQVWDNGNCALMSCPLNTTCIMRDNADAFCEFTRNHWAWYDENFDGQLDPVKRWDGTAFRWIYELWNGGWVLTNNTVDDWAIAPYWNTWAVAGVRSPASSNYGLELYGDNNHNHYLTGSSFTGQTVDFVVADYNHTRRGVDHVKVVSSGGGNGDYRLGFENGDQFIYPNGIPTGGSWSSGEVVRVYDVPLVAGETLEFEVRAIQSAVDLGMSLFRSNGDTYYSSRAAAVWTVDAAGNGGSETRTYTAPTTDVYGLVLFSNDATAGGFDVRIGPNNTFLIEEEGDTTSEPLNLYTTLPGAGWSAYAARGAIGADAVLEVYDDADYQQPVAVSDGNPGAEFVVQYQPTASPHWLKSSNEGAGGSLLTTEWDYQQSHDGFSNGVLLAPDVVRVWPVNPGPGTFLFRQYHPTSSPNDFDTSFYLMKSDGSGAEYFTRGDQIKGSDSRPWEDGGEWFEHRILEEDDEYAMVLLSDAVASSYYEIWWGRLIGPNFDQVYTETGRVAFAQTEETTEWAIAAARQSAFGDDIDVYLSEDDDFGDQLASSLTSGRANFAVLRPDRDGNAVYARFRQNDPDRVAFKWEVQTPDEDFVLSDGPVVSTRSWTESEVVELHTLRVEPPQGGQTVTFDVADLTGNLDLGLALYISQGRPYHATWSQAAALAEDFGEGAGEGFEYTFQDTVLAAVVVFNENAANGDYELRIYDSATTETGPVTVGPAELALHLRGGNPFTRTATFQLDLPEAGPVDVSVFDTGGRHVHEIVNGSLQPGYHELRWEGQARYGEAAAGTYFVRARTKYQTLTQKVTLVR